MHFSIAKKSDVPVGEQLEAQIIVGIVSSDCKPGEKLPSTRELGRRLAVHPNTISAVYRRLAERGWVIFRKGSGVYIRELRGDPPLEGCLELDQMISVFIRLARGRGFSLEEIKSRARLWLDLQPPDHLLLIDPNQELRQILKAEIQTSCCFPVRDKSLQELKQFTLSTGAVPLCLYGLAEEVRACIPNDTNLLLLHTQPLADEMKKIKGLKPGTFLTVVSHWSGFLEWARKLIAASQVPSELLSFRDARIKGWQAGLNANSCILTDLLTAPLIPVKCHTLIFKLISESSLQNVIRYVEEFSPFHSRPNKNITTQKPNSC
jgi:DNA-binding transcriptional regulator YhcF (GntR family)